MANGVLGTPAAYKSGIVFLWCNSVCLPRIRIRSCFPKHSRNKQLQAVSLLTIISKPTFPASPVPQRALSLFPFRNAQDCCLAFWLLSHRHTQLQTVNAPQPLHLQSVHKEILQSTWLRFACGLAPQTLTSAVFYLA